MDLIINHKFITVLIIYTVHFSGGFFFLLLLIKTVFCYNKNKNKPKENKQSPKIHAPSFGLPKINDPYTKMSNHLK